MRITPEVIRHEFIGTDARVVRSSNAGSVGLSGKVVDETRNTFTLLHKSRGKIVEKRSTVFCFGFSDGTAVEIEGRLLIGRPEDRLKKSIRRLW